MPGVVILSDEDWQRLIDEQRGALRAEISRLNQRLEGLDRLAAQLPDGSPPDRAPADASAEGLAALPSQANGRLPRGQEGALMLLAAHRGQWRRIPDLAPEARRRDVIDPEADKAHEVLRSHLIRLADRGLAERRPRGAFRITAEGLEETRRAAAREPRRPGQTGHPRPARGRRGYDVTASDTRGGSTGPGAGQGGGR